MARALTADERLRYPWASVITDYVPPGRMRRVGLWCGALGLAYLVLGALLLVFFTSHVSVKNGIPQNVGAALIFYPSYAALAVGGVIGLVTGVQAAMKGAKSTLVWSIGAFIPGLLVLVILLLL
jgi:hypothetical protein